MTHCINFQVSQPENVSWHLRLGLGTWLKEYRKGILWNILYGAFLNVPLTDLNISLKPLDRWPFATENKHKAHVPMATMFVFTSEQSKYVEVRAEISTVNWSRLKLDISEFGTWTRHVNMHSAGFPSKNICPEQDKGWTRSKTKRS